MCFCCPMISFVSLPEYMLNLEGRIQVTGDIPWDFDRILACARSLSTKTLGRPEGVWRFFVVREIAQIHSRKHADVHLKMDTWKGRSEILSKNIQ